MPQPSVRFVRGALVLTAAFWAGCAAQAYEPKSDATTLDELSVSGGVTGACSTSVVRGLTEQLVAEVNCIHPGAFSRIDRIPGVSLGTAAQAAPYLHGEAAAALRRSAATAPVEINSALRTLPQQYLLKQWQLRGRCGIRAAASPGRSNHETGLALDVSNRSSAQRTLESNGFSWFGSGDPVHFDFRGGMDLRASSVLAFQRLWNRNHPSDRIAEDGDYGSTTEDRLRRAPAEGFPIGATCMMDSPADSGGPTPTPRPSDPAPSDPAPSDPAPSDPAPTPSPSPTPSICDSGADCASCNAIATQCGWCAGTGRCMEGDGAGPYDGACTTGWQWVAPSSCSMGSDPAPTPTPTPEPAPMCEPVQGSCGASADCCSGLDCRRGVSFPERCCGRSGTSCSTGGDCCGYMDCVSGVCMCRPAGRACLADGDCCSGSCRSGSCG